ncbi:MAG: response regulator [Phycisphaerae bacterium]|nr:response regulator [Phycisphaerae bacterium]NUQ49127.1 response regulator [Phycisphaerae bacterium]
MPAAPKARILIADDNPQIVELLEAYLEPLGVTVLTAMDGEKALQVTEDESPDLVLLDVMMPKHSGFEVCRQLKQNPRHRDRPIVMVTALNEVGDIERAKECGADEFLTKPVNKIELLTCVTRLLRDRPQSGFRPDPPPA